MEVRLDGAPVVMVGDSPRQENLKKRDEVCRSSVDQNLLYMF